MIDTISSVCLTLQHRGLRRFSASAVFEVYKTRSLIRRPQQVSGKRDTHVNVQTLQRDWKQER